MTKLPATIWLGEMIKYYLISDSSPERLKTYFTEVDESSSESKGGVNTSSSVTCKTLFGGVLCTHFTEGDENTVT